MTISRAVTPASSAIEPDSQPEPNGRLARGVSSSPTTLLRKFITGMLPPFSGCRSSALEITECSYYGRAH